MREEDGVEAGVIRTAALAKEKEAAAEMVNQEIG